MGVTTDTAITATTIGITTTTIIIVTGHGLPLSTVAPTTTATIETSPLFEIAVVLVRLDLVAGGGAALPTSVTSNADKVWVVYLQA
jgi:hypothetical protein